MYTIITDNTHVYSDTKRPWVTGTGCKYFFIEGTPGEAVDWFIRQYPDIDPFDIWSPPYSGDYHESVFSFYWYDESLDTFLRDDKQFYENKKHVIVRRKDLT